MGNQISLRELYQSDGEQVFTAKLCELLDKGEVKPEQISLNRLASAITGRYCDGESVLQEAIQSGTFQTITTKLISKKVIDAYTLTPTLGMSKLVEVVPSNKQVEKIAGWAAWDMPKVVAEGEEYPQMGTYEKYFEIPNVKYGRIISLTEEAVLFDQTNELLRRAASLGEKAALHQEKLIVEKVVDAASDAYNGSALYSQASYGNYPASAANLTKTTLEAAWTALAGMTDENSDPIITTPNLILCNKDAYFKAIELMRSPEGPETANRVINVHQGLAEVQWSPFITTSQSWLYGDFKKQFKYTEIWPIQVLSRRGQDTSEGFLKDTIYQYKVRYYGGVRAIDHRFVYKGK